MSLQRLFEIPVGHLFCSGEEKCFHSSNVLSRSMLTVTDR